MKTLNEVVDLVDMTRRVIQEYEKAGLAKTPTTTNKYGHLQYDESAIERLWQIRFYRELGYNKEQIRKALSDPSYNKHDAIVEQISRLEEKKRQLESMIEIARAYNEMDVLPSDIWHEGFCCYITGDCHTRRSGGCFCFGSKFYYSVSEVSSAMRSGSSKSSI